MTADHYRVSMLTGDAGIFDISELFVGLLDEDTKRTFGKSLRSVLGKVAWRMAENQPCGPWFWDSKHAIVSSLPIERSTVSFRLGDMEHEAKVEPVAQIHRPNLWDPGDRAALAAILSSTIRHEIERHPGLDYRYGRGAGMLTLSDAAVLSRYCPPWYDRASPKELASLWELQHVPRLKGEGAPLFQPYRYIELQPSVGLRGQPLLRFGLST